VGVLLGHGWRIVADEFPCHGVRHACRFEQGGGRVTQRVKADFVLFARDVSTLRQKTHAGLDPTGKRPGNAKNSDFFAYSFLQITRQNAVTICREGKIETRTGGLFLLVYLSFLRILSKSLIRFRFPVGSPRFPGFYTFNY